MLIIHDGVFKILNCYFTVLFRFILIWPACRRTMWQLLLATNRPVVWQRWVCVRVLCDVVREFLTGILQLKMVQVMLRCSWQPRGKVPPMCLSFGLGSCCGGTQLSRDEESLVFLASLWVSQFPRLFFSLFFVSNSPVTDDWSVSARPTLVFSYTRLLRLDSWNWETS